MARRPLSCLLTALLWAGAASPASAALTAYSEGPGDEPVVRPVGGANHWYWEAVNASPGPAAVCFHWSRNGGPGVTPYDGSPWSEPARPGELPPHGCDRTPLAPGERAVYDWTLPNVEHAARYAFCATEWLRDADGTWREAEQPRACRTVRIDAQPPSVTLAVTDRHGRSGVTNEALDLRRTIGYADDVSPAAGDTRLCRISDRRCLDNGVDPFDYDRDCSDEPTGLTATFTCTWAWPYGDRLLHQCGLSFDGSLGDRAPDLGRAPGVDNPDYGVPGTGNFAIGCDVIRIDRQPPVLQLEVTPPARPGGPVRLRAAGTDVSGLTGPWRWDFGDGSAAATDGDTVEHDYAEPGARTVTVTREDAAGNPGVARASVVVEEPLALGAPSRLPRSARTVRVTARVERPGRLRVELRRRSRAIAVARRTLTEYAALRLPLPARSRAGAYELRVTFTPAGARRPAVRRTLAVRVLTR